MVKINLLGNSTTDGGGSILKPLVVTPTGSEQEFIPDGFTGYSNVKVYGVEYSTKTIDSSTVDQTIEAESGGWNKIIVNKYTLEDLVVDSSANDQIFSSTVDGFREVIVHGANEGDCEASNIVLGKTILNTTGTFIQFPEGPDFLLDWFNDWGNYSFTGLNSIVYADGTYEQVESWSSEVGKSWPKINIKFKIKSINDRDIITTDDDDHTFLYLGIKNGKLCFTSGGTINIPINSTSGVNVNEDINMTLTYTYASVDKYEHHIQLVVSINNTKTYTFSFIVTSYQRIRLTNGNLYFLDDVTGASTGVETVRAEYIKISRGSTMLYNILPVVHWNTTTKKYVYCLINRVNKTYTSTNKSSCFGISTTKANYLLDTTTTTVYVNNADLREITVDSSTVTQTITPSGYDGFSKVIVNRYVDSTVHDDIKLDWISNEEAGDTIRFDLGVYPDFSFGSSSQPISQQLRLKCSFPSKSTGYIIAGEKSFDETVITSTTAFGFYISGSYLYGHFGTMGYSTVSSVESVGGAACGTTYTEYQMFTRTTDDAHMFYAGQLDGSYPKYKVALSRSNSGMNDAVQSPLVLFGNTGIARVGAVDMTNIGGTAYTHKFAPRLHWDDDKNDYVPCFYDSITGRYVYNSGTGIPTWQLV